MANKYILPVCVFECVFMCSILGNWALHGGKHGLWSWLVTDNFEDVTQSFDNGILILFVGWGILGNW